MPQAVFNIDAFKLFWVLTLRAYEANGVESPFTAFTRSVEGSEAIDAMDLSYNP